MKRVGWVASHASCSRRGTSCNSTTSAIRSREWRITKRLINWLAGGMRTAKSLRCPICRSSITSSRSCRNGGVTLRWPQRKRPTPSSRLERSAVAIRLTTRSCNCFGTMLPAVLPVHSLRMEVGRHESTICSINHSLERCRRSRRLRDQTTTHCSSACVSGSATTSRLISTTRTDTRSTMLQVCKTRRAMARPSSSTRWLRKRTTPVRISTPGTSSMQTGWSEFRSVVASDSWAMRVASWNRRLAAGKPPESSVGIAGFQSQARSQAHPSIAVSGPQTGTCSQTAFELGQYKYLRRAMARMGRRTFSAMYLKRIAASVRRDRARSAIETFCVDRATSRSTWACTSRSRCPGKDMHCSSVGKCSMSPTLSASMVIHSRIWVWDRIRSLVEIQTPTSVASPQLKLLWTKPKPDA